MLKGHVGRTAVLLLALGLAGSTLAREVGEAVVVRNEVKGTPPGAAARQMEVGDGIVLGLTLTTGQASGIKMTFIPHGALTLGPSTQLSVEQAVVDRATGRSVSKLSLMFGRLRLAIGRLFGGEVEVETPTTVIGIKGTLAIVDVDLAGVTTVICIEGVVSVFPKGGGDTVSLAAGQQVSAGPAGVIAPAGRLVEPLIPSASTGFEGLSVPPSWRPDDDDVTGALRPDAPASFELATTSAAAGGAAFSDPRIGTFEVTPVKVPGSAGM